MTCSSSTTSSSKPWRDLHRSNEHRDRLLLHSFRLIPGGFLLIEHHLRTRASFSASSCWHILWKIDLQARFFLSWCLLISIIMTLWSSMIIKSYMFTMASLAIEVVCLRNVVATVCLLLLHSIKLTLVTMVIFFELVIFVRLVSGVGSSPSTPSRWRSLIVL